MYDWHKHFHDGCKCVDDPSSGSPSISTNEANVKCVQDTAKTDRRKCVDQIASEVGIAVGNCHSILFHVLNLCCICQHFVPQIMMSKQKET